MANRLRKIYRLLLLSLISTPCLFSSVYAEPVSLHSDDAAWIANMIFKNECQMKTDCLVAWNEGEDFLSLGIGHFIWYPTGRSDRYRESFPELVRELESQQFIPKAIHEMIANGPPWKTRAEFLADQSGTEATQLRDFLKQTRSAQAVFMIRRFQAALLKMIETTPPSGRTLLTEKIVALTQTRNGLYAMIDYLNFKGDGLSPQERYREHGWGLFQVFYEMNWPARPDDFVEAARKVLRRRVDNAPSERREERWVEGWENRVKTYSSHLDAVSFLSSAENSNSIVLPNAQNTFEIFTIPDFSAHT